MWFSFHLSEELFSLWCFCKEDCFVFQKSGVFLETRQNGFFLFQMGDILFILVICGLNITWLCTLHLFLSISWHRRFPYCWNRRNKKRRKQLPVFNRRRSKRFHSFWILPMYTSSFLYSLDHILPYFSYLYAGCVH